jgi:hypothetical protein
LQNQVAGSVLIHEDHVGNRNQGPPSAGCRFVRPNSALYGKKVMQE